VSSASALYALLALIGGAALALQIGVNGHLRVAIGHPALATFVSFAVGALAALAASIVVRAPMPEFGKLAGLPWWVWAGGALGAFYVWSAIMAGSKLGAVMTIGLVVLGQMAMAAWLDHAGALGFPQDSLSPLKLFGIGLVVAGVVTIAYARQA
jgi:bacterial/archaeal transporter family-2 protein